ncbi:hypothetical protein LCGC14_0209170 [marine sediment metagenome]|uniref:Uncharacterized protein n=1 Tax=marine sediment metagenome TaxID=412755 RepID=A0A0F9X0Z5_9ZZZZ
MRNKQRQALKDPRVTNEGCWKSSDDNRIPNPPVDGVHQEDKHYDKVTAGKKHDTKVIMAHEFRENPEGFQAMAQTVVDSYNEENSLEVGGELPEILTKEKEESNG